MATTTHATRLEAGRRVFTRILVGIDGSQQALEAARQAALLQDVDGRLTLLSVWDVAPIVIGGPDDDDPLRLRRGTAANNRREGAARRYATTSPRTPPRPANSCAAHPCRSCSKRSNATRTRSSRSAAAAPAGCSASSKAPSRPRSSTARPARSSSRVLSTTASRAVSSSASTARSSRPRPTPPPTTSPSASTPNCTPLVAWGGKGVNERLVATITDGDHDDRHEAPAEALVAAAESADLVVVGSRGLHGFRALGSVSERVAHSAPCSTLVVREPIWQRVAEELGR